MKIKHPKIPSREWVSKSILRARKRGGLTQAELSAETGLAVSAISHFECGRRMPSIQNAVCLAGALRISVDELIGREPKR